MIMHGIRDDFTAAEPAALMGEFWSGDDVKTESAAARRANRIDEAS
jgi:hypothetical protein